MSLLGTSSWLWRRAAQPTAIPEACRWTASRQKKHTSSTREAETMLANCCVRRGRERRLRAMLRHELQSIAMALATVTHHSCQVGTKNGAPRGQETVTSAVGMRPTPLSEVAGPQATVTVGYVAAGPPSLGWTLPREAEEEEPVRLLEDEVVEKESRLLEELENVRDGPHRPSWATVSGIEKAAVHWHVVVDKARKNEKGRKKRKRRRRRLSCLLLMIPCCFSPHFLRVPCIWQFCSVSWCCYFGFGFYWEMTSCAFPCSFFVGSTVNTVHVSFFGGYGDVHTFST